MSTRVAVLLLMAAGAICAGSVAADSKPVAARVGVDERPGATLALDLRVTDQLGQPRALRDLIAHDKPTVLSLAYYHCPGLCDVSLRELATALRASGWSLGDDYQALTVSIDPHDQPLTAAAKRANVFRVLKTTCQGAQCTYDWPFVVATEPVITQLTAALGYRYDYDAGTKQYAHPAVSIVLTPNGTIARYLYGPTLDIRTLSLALREARAGRASATAWVDRTLLACFRYDSTTHRYEWLISSIMRGGAAMFALLLAAAIASFIRRGRAHRAEV
jgi:protein SCO1/2